MAVQYAFGKIVTQGLDLNVDAADPTSYPGSGTAWTSVVNRSITGSIVSCSFSSDFKGGIVFDNPTASVEFPGTLANYGTGSFTVEMAFRPSHIEGIHYLVSKNSGSYPNWGMYLSGSGGSGKLFAEYNIDASVSCSVSSSTTFETGSNYFVDTIFSPIEKRLYITINGSSDSISSPGNGTGSLSTTSSLLLGNTTTSSSQSYSGSIFNSKIYNTFTLGGSNYRTIAQRIKKTPPVYPSAFALVIGGGGSGGEVSGISGGGGGGGFLLTPLTLTKGDYTVTVGAGGVNGANGDSSSINTLIAYGGGAGGGYTNNPGVNGASGGGGGASNNGTTITAGSAIYGAQGNDGGAGKNYGSSGGGGGGGGAGAPGGIAGVGSRAGKGGDGLPTIITGVVTYYAGGGGGGNYAGGGNNEGFGGIGGGADGSTGNAIAGTPNTGGGGGGGGYNVSIKGGDGGSGIVIIRYPGGPIATGGTITSVGGDTIHTFTATGSHTFTVF